MHAVQRSVAMGLIVDESKRKVEPMTNSTPKPQTTERIVVGVDGSAASIDAVRWAARQAQLTGAALEAVIAWQYPMSSSGYLLGVQDDWQANAQSVIEHAMELADLPADLVTAQRVIEGHPAEMLIQTAMGADLLVVGSRGHGGFAGMLIGSVSEHVCSHAPCPVLVVRHLEAQ